ncbi:MAG: TIGR02147 family protein, partial [Bacteriovoracaceae bacterium]|nr:TIGR02147 family protein [Bacteriovoracaceae bacterium]
MENMTYRTILEEEINFRMKENCSYSLRAFARDIGISPSQLSDIFKGKTGLSSKKAVSIAQKLGLSKKETELFKALVEVEHGRSPIIVQEAQRFISSMEYNSKFKGLSLDGFKLISDWEYFAILSAMELDDYDGTTEFLKNELGLDQSVVEDCIKRLLKLDLIDLKNGKFVATGEMFTTSHDIASTALKRFHKQ